MKNSIFTLGLFLYSLQLFSQGNLVVYPKRIEFDNLRDRVKTVSLTNTGSDTTSYRIFFSQIRMTSNGEMQEIKEPDPGQNFANKNVRFFPRHITIAPKKSQLVKLQLIRTGDLKDGEYRSHLVFQAQLKNQSQKPAEKVKANQISINIKPLFGLGIPVIIKKGTPEITVELSKLAVEKEDEHHFLSLDVSRKGNMSPYGIFEVNYFSPSGEKTKVARIMGISVYIPTQRLKLKLRLLDSKKIDYNQGRLIVSYTSMPPETISYAENEIKL